MREMLSVKALAEYFGASSAVLLWMQRFSFAWPIKESFFLATAAPREAASSNFSRSFAGRSLINLYSSPGAESNQRRVCKSRFK